MRNTVLINVFVLLAVSAVKSESKVFYVELIENKEIPAFPILEYEQQNIKDIGEKIVLYK